MANYDNILKRAKKIIKNAQDRENAPKIKIIDESDTMPESNGLVIILFNITEVELAA